MAELKITNRDELAVWLKGKPQKWAIALSVRAALRVVPLTLSVLSDSSAASNSEKRREIELLPLFNNMASAYFASLLSVYRIQLITRIHLYDLNTKKYAENYTNFSGIDARTVSAAFKSAFYAANAVRNETDSADADVIFSATYAAQSVASASHSTSTVWSAVFHDAKQIDATGLDSLRTTPLWPEGDVPRWAQEAFENFRNHLLKLHEDWQVWTDWYEAILAGKPAWGLSPEFGNSIMFTALTWQEEEWAKGPAHVNGLMAKMIEAKRPKAALPREMPPKSAKVPKPKTKIGKAVVANIATIAMATEPLLVLIDQEVERLTANKPNDPEGLATFDAQVAHLKSLRANIAKQRDTAIDFAAGRVPEKTVQVQTNAFAAGLKDWWKKDHRSICTNAVHVALFTGTMGLASLCGVPIDPRVFPIVAGVLVGGKPIVEALRAAKGLFK